MLPQKSSALKQKDYVAIREDRQHKVSFHPCIISWPYRNDVWKLCLQPQSYYLCTVSAAETRAVEQGIANQHNQCLQTTIPFYGQNVYLNSRDPDESSDGDLQNSAYPSAIVTNVTGYHTLCSPYIFLKYNQLQGQAPIIHIPSVEIFICTIFGQPEGRNHVYRAHIRRCGQTQF